MLNVLQTKFIILKISRKVTKENCDPSAIRSIILLKNFLVFESTFLSFFSWNEISCNCFIKPSQNPKAAFAKKINCGSNYSVAHDDIDKKNIFFHLVAFSIFLARALQQIGRGFWLKFPSMLRAKRVP